VFVVLALLFAFSFVLFGVGNAGGLSFFDYFTHKSASSSATSTSSGATAEAIASAQAAVTKTPNDAAAWSALGAAWTAKASAELGTDASAAAGSSEAATKAYERAALLKRSDVATQTALAKSYQALAGSYQAAEQQLSTQASDIQSGASNPTQFLPGGQATNLDAFSRATNDLSTQATSRLQNQALPLLTKAQAAETKALGVFRKLADLQPTNGPAWYDLARAADATGDTATAIKAYKQFVKILPGDPLVPDINARLAQLEPKPKPKPTTSGGTATTGGATTAPTTTAGTTTG